MVNVCDYPQAVTVIIMCLVLSNSKRTTVDLLFSYILKNIFAESLDSFWKIAHPAWSVASRETGTVVFEVMIADGASSRKQWKMERTKLNETIDLKQLWKCVCLCDSWLTRYFRDNFLMSLLVFCGIKSKIKIWIVDGATSCSALLQLYRHRRL